MLDHTLHSIALFLIFTIRRNEGLITSLVIGQGFIYNKNKLLYEGLITSRIIGQGIIYNTSNHFNTNKLLYSQCFMRKRRNLNKF